MKSLSVAEILKRNGMELSEIREGRPADSNKASQYFEYHAGACGEVINVESTATSVMGEILRLSVFQQASVFLSILHEIESPGDQVVITGDEKKRGARVVRLKSDDPKVYELLLTH